MIGHILVYAFLAIVLGAMVFVIGIPWLTPKPRHIDRTRSQEEISHAHR